MGVEKLFKWREQLRRHKTKCSFTPKDIAVKYKPLQDGTFQCETCYQPFTKQSNASRHIKKNDCNKPKEIKVHVCDVCSTDFTYKSYLDRHVKTHQNSKKTNSTETALKITKTPRRSTNIKDFITSQAVDGPTHSQSPVSFDIVSEVEKSAFYDNDLFQKDLISTTTSGINLNSTSPLYDIDLAESYLFNETVVNEDPILAESDVLNETIMINNEILAENNILNDSESVHDDQIHFNSTSISSDLNNLPCPNIDSVDRKDYFRLYKQRQRKTANLENIMSNLASPQKRKVIHNVSHSLGEIVAFTDSNCIYVAKIFQGFISHLQKLWKKGAFTEFHKLLDELFSDHLHNEEFLRWLAGKLELSKRIRLMQSIEKYRRNDFLETRGRKQTNWQAVYDVWIECSITSTDGRNGRNVVNIKKNIMCHLHT